MLEPCLHVSDEAQALRRCHRVGQSMESPIRCVVLYVCESIEERLLANRKDWTSVMELNSDQTVKKKASEGQRISDREVLQMKDWECLFGMHPKS